MRAGALSLLLASALILLSAAGVSADANPANHGHHYGQLKHQHVPAAPPPVQVPPPPAQVPPPPAQVPPPTTTTPPPTTTTPPSATTAPRPAPGGPASSLSQIAATITSEVPPATEIRPALPLPQEVKIVSALPQHDPLWWLLLVLVATLAVLWLFVSVQLARTAFKRRAAQVS